ncbi:DUF5715 family protein [Tunturibacter empetritectus]|uniref:Peptidase M15A C-terminal domain-containing protein n=1 Tax=Tunturiibacter empetritectus TaxID=3069691 RepID=A0A7W8IKH2_9BACT|nr:DUF5715 family protein [Edaphobacter lichenicola]MBB5318724.1 hypothetical protein [Edaphobacter lichenicola]
MMRLNAPIPALLALAALCFSSADSLAKPMHHPSAHKKTVAAVVAKHPDKRKAAAKPTHAAHGSKHHSTPKTDPPMSARVRARSANRRHLRHSVSASLPKATQPELTASARASQKATSEDFLRAAAASTQVETQAALAIHGASRSDARPEELNETRQAAAAPARKTASSPKPVSVAKPVPVISVVRPATERPQLASVEEVASTPVILPNLYNKRGRLIVPPPLKGSHEILVHQNEVADRDGLSRIQDDGDLMDMRSKKLLVALPENDALQVDDRLPVNRRYCRPWTAQFLGTLARAHYARFHTPLQVNSAVRTVEFQQHLVHINGNAAPAEGDTASPHLTGQAVDIAKHGLSLAEIAWLRGYLLPLVQSGKVDVEEEFQQSCFHVSVYKRYLPLAPERDLAILHHGGTSALAAALR